MPTAAMGGKSDLSTAWEPAWHPASLLCRPRWRGPALLPLGPRGHRSFVGPVTGTPCNAGGRVPSGVVQGCDPAAVTAARRRRFCHLRISLLGSAQQPGWCVLVVNLFTGHGEAEGLARVGLSQDPVQSSCRIRSCLLPDLVAVRPAVERGAVGSSAEQGAGRWVCSLAVS